MAGLLSENISDAVKLWDVSSEVLCRNIWQALWKQHGAVDAPRVREASHVDILLQVFLGGQTSPAPFHPALGCGYLTLLDWGEWIKFPWCLLL